MVKVVVGFREEAFPGVWEGRDDRKKEDLI
jgi:hypothetical protein